MYTEKDGPNRDIEEKLKITQLRARENGEDDFDVDKERAILLGAERTPYTAIDGTVFNSKSDKDDYNNTVRGQKMWTGLGVSVYQVPVYTPRNSSAEFDKFFEEAQEELGFVSVLKVRYTINRITWFSRFVKKIKTWFKK